MDIDRIDMKVVLDQIRQIVKFWWIGPQIPAHDEDTQDIVEHVGVEFEVDLLDSTAV